MPQSKFKTDFWRSIEEYAETEEFQNFVRREYPSRLDAIADPISRRRFLQVMAASLALAGLGACTRAPAETIVPYVRQPEEIVPGKPLYFATAMSLRGYAVGLLVESHMGRPTKVEGNPLHPASLGATDAFAQASILTLYDPDRSRTSSFRGRIRPWSAFIKALQPALESHRKDGGAGLRILTGSVSSPTLADQLRGLLKAYPAARWHQYEPAAQHHARAGARLAFGAYAQVQYRFDRAEVIVALDAEPLTWGCGNLRYVRDFTQARNLTPERTEMNRFYAVETTPSSVGAMADHRLALAPSEMERFARALGSKLNLGGAAEPLGAERQRWLDAAARDLQAHRGRSLIVAGEPQSPAVHALVHAMNAALGNAGQTVIYTEPVEAEPVDEIASLRDLAADIERDTVATLLILGGNPVYTAPADFEFTAKLRKVPLSIHVGLYENETAATCHWHIPAAHYLESWSDTRAYDGTVTIVQPLIAPLYGGRTAHDMIAAVSGVPQRSAYEVVRDHWRTRSGKQEQEFERWWRKSLHDGVIEGSAFPAKSFAVNLARLTGDVKAAREPQSPSPGTGRGETGKQKAESGNQASVDGESKNPEALSSKSLEVVFRPDPTIFDGRFANNAWLQELPKPLTKLTWDNAAYVSPATAERLGLKNRSGWRGGDTYAPVIELQLQGRMVRAPVCILPGQAENTVTLSLGYGRTRAGRVGSNIGYDAYRLRSSTALWSATGVQIQSTTDSYRLAVTQLHHRLEGRDLVRAATFEQLRKNPELGHGAGHNGEVPSLNPEYQYPGADWGMAIDLTLCVGCNACVVACQAENNIPVVGKAEVLRSREMHWLRIDTYYKGEPENPETYYEPILCMHCEKAPCEVVCPVTATAHSAEGLNDMVYNRCVGTRYCSNNCPYKVRRFNFFEYSDWQTESLKSMRNPDVTVRSRGVMEKCTYCVQRINQGRIQAELEGRSIRDGEITTACQQACPAQAIVFGDINNPGSMVTQRKASLRNFGLLEELNTQPRTTYLAAVRNPNPELVATEKNKDK
ncbi:MAG TPA: TAT-variant-translocated molybdopterin oxidoreductase [Candidatus Binatia bacterium]|nr:TAT-variant-translocated molybdopterin oxidoreductase [Candidatus Binatia bacterium]